MRVGQQATIGGYFCEEVIELSDGDTFEKCHFIRCEFVGPRCKVSFHDCVFDPLLRPLKVGSGSEIVGCLFVADKDSRW